MLMKPFFKRKEFYLAWYVMLFNYAIFIHKILFSRHRIADVKTCLCVLFQDIRSDYSIDECCYG